MIQLKVILCDAFIALSVREGLYLYMVWQNVL